MWFAKAAPGLEEYHHAKVRFAAKVLSGRKNLPPQITFLQLNSMVLSFAVQESRLQNGRNRVRWSE
jgi:hypothetical protein